MIENNSTDVFAAFEMLLEEIEAEIGLINKTVNRAMERRDYDGARDALDYAAQATTFRDKIVSLREGYGKSPKRAVYLFSTAQVISTDYFTFQLSRSNLLTNLVSKLNT